MKAGSIVYVPSDVILLRTIPPSPDMDLESLVYFKTVHPKKALFIGEHSTNDSRVWVEYGENTWHVDKKHITFMEFTDGS
jgi:hypothetical protein